MIAIGCDHTALELKAEIIRHLEKRGETVKDYGVYTTERSDYPVIAETVACAVVSGDAARGILICGTGVGMSIAANKVRGVRCVCCSEPYSAEFSRRHNDTNILAFGARVLGSELAKMITDSWLDAPYEGGRHAPRVEMLSNLEHRA